MKTIYLDTEFSEGFFKPIGWLPKWFPGNKPRWSIELISIGLVDNEGKEYYAINKDFKRSRCNDWVKENVLTKLPERLIIEDNWWDRYHGIEPEDSEMYTPNPVYKSIAEIKQGIMEFVNPTSGEGTLNNKAWNDHLNKYKVVATENRPIQFKAYYADYDWILFCTIFGTMDQLPAGFPMYCIDIKQEMDRMVVEVYAGDTHYHRSDIADTFDLKLSWFEGITGFPKPEDEHSSISDARFNKQLDEFILSL